MSKKKKKKKTPLDLDAAMPEDKTDAAPRQVLEQQIEQTVVVEDGGPFYLLLMSLCCITQGLMCIVLSARWALVERYLT